MNESKTKCKRPRTAGVSRDSAAVTPSRPSSHQPHRYRKKTRQPSVERPPVPAWMLDTPMHSKIPMVAAPAGKIMLYTTGLCEKLHVTPAGLKFDSSPQGLSMAYRSLHDPHLKGYFTLPRMYSHLMRSGFLTPCGMVKCSLKEFNDYHQYVKQVQLEKLTQQRRQMMEKHHIHKAQGHPHKPHYKKRKEKQKKTQDAATASSKHRKSSPTKSFSRRAANVDTVHRDTSRAAAKSTARAKTPGKSVTQADHRETEHKHKKARRMKKTQAYERQSLLLRKRFEEEMRREEELERRKLVKKAERELKLQEQWDRREAMKEAQLVLEASQREEDEAKAAKVKLMWSKIAEAHHARRQAIFQSVCNARAKLVAQRETIIARRLEKRLARIRRKYDRRYRRQWAAFKRLLAKEGLDEIQDDQQKEHREGSMPAPWADEATGSIKGPSKRVSSGSFSPKLSSAQEYSSSSDEHLVRTPTKKEQPVISITEEVLSVTSLDYRESVSRASQPEEETEDVSMMQDVYLADESSEEEGNLQEAVSLGAHPVSSGMGMASDAEETERLEDGNASDESGSCNLPESKHEHSSLSTGGESSSESTTSLRSVSDKSLEKLEGGDTKGKQVEDAASEKEWEEEKSQAKSEDAASTESEFWKSQSEASLHEGSLSSFTEEEEIEQDEMETTEEKGKEDERGQKTTEEKEDEKQDLEEEKLEKGGEFKDKEDEKELVKETLKVEEVVHEKNKEQDTEEDKLEAGGEIMEEKHDVEKVSAMMKIEEEIREEDEAQEVEEKLDIEDDKLGTGQGVDEKEDKVAETNIEEKMDTDGEAQEKDEDQEVEERLDKDEVQEKMKTGGEVEKAEVEVGDEKEEEKMETGAKAEGTEEADEGEEDEKHEDQMLKTETEGEIREKPDDKGKVQEDEMDQAGKSMEVKQQAGDLVASVIERSLHQLSTDLISPTGHEEGEQQKEQRRSQEGSQDEGGQTETETSVWEGDQGNGGQDDSLEADEKEETDKLVSDSTALAYVLNMLEEVEQEIHHHHHHHDSHLHEHHHHEHHHDKQDDGEDGEPIPDSESESSSGSSSSSEEREEGEIIGVVENEIIAKEASVTSLRGCLSGESVTGLTEVVKETEDHRIIFEGALMPLKHHSSTSSASSRVSINVTAAVLSADSLKLDSSGRLIHGESHSHTKPEHKMSLTNVPSDIDHPAKPDDEAPAESSHHHYSNIIPIYHDNLIHVSEELIDENLSAISMKPDRHHKVPSTYSAGSRNSFRNIFRPDMTYCQGSAKCLKDTLVRELSHPRHSRHSKHSSNEMDKYYSILETAQEDITARHSEEELVTVDESEGVCYLPKRRTYKVGHTITAAVQEQDEDVTEDASTTEEAKKPKRIDSGEMKHTSTDKNLQSDQSFEGNNWKDEQKTLSSGDDKKKSGCADAPANEVDTLQGNRQTSREESQVTDETVGDTDTGLGQGRAQSPRTNGCGNAASDSDGTQCQLHEAELVKGDSSTALAECHSKFRSSEIGTTSEIQTDITPKSEPNMLDDVVIDGPCEVTSHKDVEGEGSGESCKKPDDTDDEKHQYENGPNRTCPVENGQSENNISDNLQDNHPNENCPNENCPNGNLHNGINSSENHQNDNHLNVNHTTDAPNQEPSLGRDSTDERQTESEERSYTLSAASPSSSTSLPISCGENLGSSSSSFFDSDHPLTNQGLIPNVPVDPQMDTSRANDPQSLKDVAGDVDPEARDEMSNQHPSTLHQTDSDKYLLSSSAENVSSIPTVTSHPVASESKSSSSRASGSKLSAVMKKISSVLSVGRKRSSRVHPGDDTDDGAKATAEEDAKKIH